MTVRDINDRGEVVGYAQTADGSEHAFYWNGETTADLGEGRAVAINERGDVISTNDSASTDSRGGTQSFLWRNGTKTDLGDLGGRLTHALDINDAGEVVGTGQLPDETRHAFIWKDGAIRDLGTLGGLESEATHINNRGQVFGTSAPPGDPAYTSHAFVWEDGVMTNIGPLDRRARPPSEFTRSFPSGLSAHQGVSILASNYDYGNRGFLWRDGATTLVEPYGDEVSVFLAGVNDAGETAGEAKLRQRDSDIQLSRAFFWRDGITTTVVGPAGEAERVVVRAIDAHGQIGGGAFVSDDGRAFSWKGGEGIYLDSMPSFAPVMNDRGQLAGVVNGVSGRRWDTSGCFQGQPPPPPDAGSSSGTSSSSSSSGQAW